MVMFEWILCSKKNGGSWLVIGGIVRFSKNRGTSANWVPVEAYQHGSEVQRAALEQSPGEDEISPAGC